MALGDLDVPWGLCHNAHSHGQAEQGTLEPHLDTASLLGPCSQVCSACDIFQAVLGADRLLSFGFIYSALDMNSLPLPLFHIVTHYNTVPRTLDYQMKVLGRELL